MTKPANRADRKTLRQRRALDRADARFKAGLGQIAYGDWLRSTERKTLAQRADRKLSVVRTKKHGKRLRRLAEAA